MAADNPNFLGDFINEYNAEQGGVDGLLPRLLEIAAAGRGTVEMLSFEGNRSVTVFTDADGNSTAFVDGKACPCAIDEDGALWFKG